MNPHYDEQAHAEWLAQKILDGESVGVLSCGSFTRVYFDLSDILEGFGPEVSDYDAVNAWIDGNWDEIIRCAEDEAEEYRAELYIDAA